MNNSKLGTLIFCITNRCNLSCRYCYMDSCEKGVDMGWNILETAIGLAASKRVTRIQITGGEPLLAKPQVKFLIETASKMKNRPAISIQTNGTLIDESWAAFFKQHEVEIGISIDGPPEINSYIRGQSGNVLRAMGIIQKAGIDFGVTAVVTKYNILHLDRLALMLACFKSCKGLGLDFVVKKGRAAQSHLLAGRDELKKGIDRLKQTIDFISRNGKYLFFREAERLKRPAPPGTPFCQAASGRCLAVHPDGNLYPCSQTLSDSRFLIGHVTAPLPETLISPVLERAMLIKAETCISCSLNNICPSDCPSRIFYNEITGHGRQEIMACSIYKALAL